MSRMMLKGVLTSVILGAALVVQAADFGTASEARAMLDKASPR